MIRLKLLQTCLRFGVLAEEGSEVPGESGTCLESCLCCEGGLAQVPMLCSIQHAVQRTVHDTHQIDFSLVLLHDLCASVRVVIK